MKRWFRECVLDIKSPSREALKPNAEGKTITQLASEGFKEGLEKVFGSSFAPLAVRIDLTESNFRWLTVKTRMPELVLRAILDNSYDRDVVVFFEFVEGQIAYTLYEEDRSSAQGTALH